jgi:hypothetical protein
MASTADIANSLQNRRWGRTKRGQAAYSHYFMSHNDDDVDHSDELDAPARLLSGSSRASSRMFSGAEHQPG